MEENKQTHQQNAAPQDYSRYMGTLNRIYRRSSSPRSKKLGDGIDSLKNGGQTPQQPPAGGKKDRSFQIVLAAVVVGAGLYWAVTTVLQMF